MQSFASDNCSGVAPEIMQALVEANAGHARPYGDDALTARAQQAIMHALGRDALVLFVYNGTGANTLAVKLACQSHESVLHAQTSHLSTLEVNAPFALTGAKSVSTPSFQGKIVAEALEETIARETLWGRHNSQPRLVSLTQATECGTHYSLGELQAIRAICNTHGLFLHMDASRICNAAAAMNVSLAELCEHVDLLSLGGAKNGLMFGEALAICHKSLRSSAPYLQKQLLQLHSKNRFLAAQFIPYFEEGLWHQYASHANRMMAVLSERLLQQAGTQALYPVASNQLFLKMPVPLMQRLRERSSFYVYDEQQGIVRFITSFDTTQASIDHLLQE